MSNPLRLTLVSALIVLVAIVGTVRSTVQHIDDSSQQFVHRQAVLAAIETTLSEVEAAQNGVRGYVSSRDQ